MAPHSSTLAWKIPWMEEPGRLWSMGSLRVGHNWATSLSLFTFTHWKRKWQPTPVFLPRESQGRGSLVGCRLWDHTESDTTEVTQQQQQQQQRCCWASYNVQDSSPNLDLLGTKCQCCQGWEILLWCFKLFHGTCSEPFRIMPSSSPSPSPMFFPLLEHPYLVVLDSLWPHGL